MQNNNEKSYSPTIKEQSEDRVIIIFSFICGAVIGSYYNYSLYNTLLRASKLYNNILTNTMYSGESSAATKTTIIGAISTAAIATSLTIDYVSFKTAATNFLLMTVESTFYFVGNTIDSNALKYSAASLLIHQSVYNTNSILDMIGLDSNITESNY